MSKSYAKSMRNAAALVALTFAVGGCVTDPVTGKAHISLVRWSPQDELRAGREYSPNVESQFDAVHPDAEATRVLGGLVSEMVTHSVRRDDFQFRFKILNSSIPNAFALPGGYVYITRGLVALLESEGQFISVMGHELGHVEHQHSMRNQSRGKVTGVLTSPLRVATSLVHGLPGENIVGLAAGVVVAPLALWGLKFNRGQETEADERGVYFAAEMGYDPREGAKTFELFERLENESSSSSVSSELAWFRSHPLNSDRIDNIQKTIARKYPQLLRAADREFRQSSDSFLTVLERFRKQAAAYGIYDEAITVLTDSEVTPADFEKAEASIERAQSLVPEEPLFLVGKGEAAITRKDWAAARSHFSKALDLYDRLTPGDSHWKAHFYLGFLGLEAKQIKVATEHLLTARKLFPLQPLVNLFLGRAYEIDGKRALAKAAYKNAMDASPSDSEVYRAAADRWSKL